MKQKKFMNIQRLKGGFVNGFIPGDLVVIQEKFDRSNAAVRYNVETGKMVDFSRNKMLDQNNTLNGFYSYIQEFNPDDYKNVPKSIVTWRRVEKEIYKMRDEGLLLDSWCEQDMKIVVKNLSDRIYHDCEKEEPEIVKNSISVFWKTLLCYFNAICKRHYSRSDWSK